MVRILLVLVALFSAVPVIADEKPEDSLPYLIIGADGRQLSKADIEFATKAFAFCRRTGYDLDPTLRYRIKQGDRRAQMIYDEIVDECVNVAFGERNMRALPILR